MIIYQKYIDMIMHTWYDSSNLLYSKCYDSNGPTATLNVVFADGRTYKYKDVYKEDFMQLQSAPSNGKAFGQYIRSKYQGIRMADTSREDLENLKQELINMDTAIQETRHSDLVYNVKYDNATGNVALYRGTQRIFRGVEGQISLLNLLRCMNIQFGMSEATEEDFTTDEASDSIIVESFKENKTDGE